MRHRDMYPSFMDTPLIFLRVCRTWRNITLRTPRLWTALRVTDGYSARKDQVLGHAMLFQWMERAGCSPMEVTLRRSDPDQRWSNIFMQILDQVRAKLFRQISNLRRLRIDVPRIYALLPDSERKYESIPMSLTTVELTYLAPSRIRLPWDQLTNFSTNVLSATDCLQFHIQSIPIRL
ncbi:hypothetical protein C8R44DRAFT_876235 [Mycena epipterygia]|nr:hypothetical protein C8R44DRAFT_876235 [Mycena epipterygia]